MADSTIINFQYSFSYWVRTLVRAIMANVLAMIQIMALDTLLKLVKFCRTCFHTRRMLAAGALIVYQAHKALALPMPSEDDSTDIAIKSYNLNRTSFIVMATMGAIMTVIALIQIAMTIAKSCPGRRYRDNLPRHPANCEAGAEAHAALGQPAIDGSPVTRFEEELSPMSSEIIESAGSGETDSGKPSHVKGCQEIAPMPLERISRD
ncbi:hypothetical protein F4678DRAFT_463097 [Xylaria arbuscula]|nr:hypothetical protein F4678DRAFT_463097 [Xylaria arbuscula]